MDKQQTSLKETNPVITVSTLSESRKRSDTLLFIVIFATTFSIAPLLIFGGLSVGPWLLLGIPAALIITYLIIRWPLAGLFFIAGSALLVEIQPLTTASDLTDRLYIFYWPPGLEGQIERPIGYLFIFVILVVICHRFINRQQLLHGGGLLWPFLLFLLCVVGGVLHGLASGGDLKITVVEVRPFWYFFESYLLAYNLITRKRDLYAFFWLVIIAAGVKGLQGVYIFLVVLHGSLTGNSIMSHEESFFCIALILLVILFCLYYRYRPQLYAALLALPCEVVTLIANQRRTDYIALLLGLVMALALVFVMKPEVRKFLAVAVLLTAILGTSYILAFSSSSGLFAAPARGIVSIFNPADSSVKADSNLYRTVEDYDLVSTVKQSPLIGLGFGKPYSEPIPLITIFPGILAADMYYAYIPHNTIFWVWMRLGAIGFSSFWYLIGAAIVRGCLIARQLKDRYLQLIAIYVIGVIAMEIVVAFGDYQLFVFRNVIYVGLLMGILMKLPTLDREKNFS